jgi:hypothetical protein
MRGPVNSAGRPVSKTASRARAQRRNLQALALLPKLDMQRLTVFNRSVINLLVEYASCRRIASAPLFLPSPTQRGAEFWRA